MEQKQAPFRVLSIDGGGIRGLYSAVLLLGIAQRVARMSGQGEERLDVGRAFHLITGTSTGALLGTALAAGIPLEDVIEIYRGRAEEIFQDPTPPKGWPLFRWLIRHCSEAANSSEPLRNALEQIFKDETVEQMYQRRGIALCVPSVNIETQKAWVWKTPHDKDGNRLQRDNKYRLVDLCMSSAAAPVVFPIHGVEKPGDAAGQVNWFVDGGLWANNPSIVALTEALSFAPPNAPIEIVSVSTCPPFQALSVDAKSCDRSLFDWRGGIRVMEASIDAQSFAYDYLARTLSAQFGGRVTYLRLSDPKVSSDDASELRLDNPSKKCLKTLVRLGNEAVDMNISEATTGEKSKALLVDVFSNLPALPQGDSNV